MPAAQRTPYGKRKDDTHTACGDATTWKRDSVSWVINRNGRALPKRIDIGDRVIPAAMMAMISVIGSHVNAVYDAGDEREVRFAIAPDNYYSVK